MGERKEWSLQRWTPQEEQIMIEQYGKKTAEEIGKLLGRTAQTSGNATNKGKIKCTHYITIINKMKHL